MRSNTEKRYKKIQKRFDTLHKVDRLRYDDCEEVVCDEFCISKVTLQRILSTKIESKCHN